MLFCCLYILQLREIIFFCRGAEYITWRVNTDWIKWLSEKNHSTSNYCWIFQESSASEQKIIHHIGCSHCSWQPNNDYINLLCKNSLDHFGSFSGRYCPCAVELTEYARSNTIGWTNEIMITPVAWNIWKLMSDSNPLGGKYCGVHFYVFQSHGHKFFFIM